MLNQHLAVGTQKKYEVINPGVDGYGTEREYLYFHELGNRYRPDLVIVGLNYNDVDDVMTPLSFTFIKNWINKHSYFLSYLKGLQISLKKIIKIYSKGLPMGFFQIYQDQYTPEFEKALLKT